MTRYCAVLCTSRLYCTQVHCIVHKCAVFFLQNSPVLLYHRAVVYKFVLNSTQLHKCFSLLTVRSHSSWWYRAQRLLCCYVNFVSLFFFLPFWGSVEMPQFLLLQFFLHKLAKTKIYSKRNFHYTKVSNSHGCVTHER